MIRAVPVVEAVTALTVLDALLDAPAVLPDTPRRDLPRVPEG